jgi:ubiquinone/menaquinone biosynthesis C-methylase UbiE
MVTGLQQPPADGLDGVKERQQGAWAAGDYSQVGSRILITSELLCEAVDLRGGERVLDVATGNGNAALAAARRFCDVVGLDYVPALLDAARARARAEGLDVTFLQGDAEDLPFPDRSFDAVLSACGVMFAPSQERAAAELVRVCRRGGRIGMVNWTADGFVGAMLRTIGRYTPPPPGVRPPTLWGTRERLKELFGAGTEMATPLRSFLFRFPSTGAWVDHFAAYFGPVVKAFEGLGKAERDALRADLLALVREFNVSGDETLVLRQDYLEVVIHVPEE